MAVQRQDWTPNIDRKGNRGSPVAESFPIYILRLGREIRIVLPDEREDLGHVDFWDQTVAGMVAAYFGVSDKRLMRFPYCQRRARIVGDKVLYGEKFDPKLLRFIRKALGNRKLQFCFDEHECRLRYDVRRFKRLTTRRKAE